MKVLKFGGSSVGTVDSILKVKEIILSQKESVIVVASALGGVTDALIQAAEMAKNSQDSFRSSIEAMKKRHLDMVRSLHSAESEERLSLESALESLFSRLSSLCEGVFLLQVLPKKALDEIVSFGERLSCLILSSIIPSSKLYDSLRFIRTCNHQHGAIVESGLTSSLIRAEFEGFEKSGRIAIVPGFISSDAVTSEITNLGRGGSDYSASLIASALKASVLEIWTDVDGFMTADPRIIATSYVIDEMSYAEAMELCNFGAKVVYPPTLYPVCREGIPILTLGIWVSKEDAKDGFLFNPTFLQGDGDGKYWMYKYNEETKEYVRVNKKEDATHYAYHGPVTFDGSKEISEYNFKVATNGGQQSLSLSEGDHGYLIFHYPLEWNSKKYLYPISQNVLTNNPNITQNFGWE